MPAKIEKQILIFPDSVVTEQWPHTLKLVNPPQNLKLLNPGECIRIGIVASGDGRDSLLEKTQLSFRVEFAGQVQNHALAAFAGIKQLKPEGLDEVIQVTAAANVAVPPISMASMGASAERWCVPDDAQDGTATIDAEVETPAGHETPLRATILIEGFETGSKRTFKDVDEFEQYSMGYHSQPNPARLYPTLQFFCSNLKMTSGPEDVEGQVIYLATALKGNPAAAKDFMARVSASSKCVQMAGLLALFMDSYDIAPALQSMGEDERAAFQQRPELSGLYDFSSPADAPAKFDLLWAIFSASGQFVAIQKISTALEWRSDWDEFDKARKSSKRIKEWTPSIGRALAYSAAGWSMSSFQQTDPLAADYIDFLIASPDTSDAVKTELKGLQTNPAFQREEKK